MLCERGRREEGEEGGVRENERCVQTKMRKREEGGEREREEG